MTYLSSVIWIIVLPSSQERMLVVVKKGFEKELGDIFEKWELNCTEVGVVTDTGHLDVLHNGEQVAYIPTAAASRYIETRLTDFAKKVSFNKNIFSAQGKVGNIFSLN